MAKYLCSNALHVLHLDRATMVMSCMQQLPVSHCIDKGWVLQCYTRAPDACFIAWTSSPCKTAAMHAPVLATSPACRLSLQACNRMSYVCVPLYETLGENAIEFILQHADVKLVVVEGCRMARMVKALREVHQLLAVIYWGPASAADIRVRLAGNLASASRAVLQHATSWRCVRRSKRARRKCRAAQHSLSCDSM